MTQKINFVMVSTTVDNKTVAQELADSIIASRLAACVQCMPINSTYRWQGAVERAGEYLLLAKTRAALADRLSAFIQERHSYEVPEIIVTPLIGGYQAYLDWINSETEK